MSYNNDIFISTNGSEPHRVKQWICDNSNYCRGRVSNDKKRDKCRNCGMKKNDGRKNNKPLRWEYIT